MSDVPEPDLLPCGCLITYVVNGGVNEMRVSSCRLSCSTLAEVLGLGREAGKPIEYRQQ